jgi:hypothetical protein
MSHTIEDLNRRNVNLSKSKVKDVLPESFSQEYPILITFLEKYYDYLDSDADTSFKTAINSLVGIRDIGQTDTKYLDELISEIGNGLKSSAFFEQPRLMTRLLAQFYRSKGNELSLEGFFRAFFNEEVSVEYGKKNIFIVGESQIGYESQKFITDNKLYQTFSLLIKSGLSVIDYQKLYTKFIHPAGFYFAGQVLIENEINFNLDSLRGAEGLTDSADNAPSLVGVATLDIAPLFTQLTSIIESDGTSIRLDVSNVIVSQYQGLRVFEVDAFYDNIAQIVNPNSFTFDDSPDPRGPDLSLVLETMDNNKFTRYNSDSAF